MDKREIKAVLNIPSSPLVEFFLDQANLGKRERESVLLCIRDGLSQEEAAERMYVDRKTIYRWNKEGVRKLSVYLDGMRQLLVDFIR